MWYKYWPNYGGLNSLARPQELVCLLCKNVYSAQLSGEVASFLPLPYFISPFAFPFHPLFSFLFWGLGAKTHFDAAGKEAGMI